MSQTPSIVHGLPLEAESAIGSLTIPGYLREVTARYVGREALVMHGAHGVQRWSYAELWDKSVGVAKALIAGGMAREQRIGILMTNRPEFLSSLFGTSIAGGVAVVFSTFSTPRELEQLLQLSDISILIFEGQVLKTDFCAVLAALEPQLASAPRDQEKFPYLRRLICLDSVSGETFSAHAAFEKWNDFLGGGAGILDSVVDARMSAVKPADPGGLFFSSGTTSLPKGILHSHRAFALQWWRYPRLVQIEEAVRCWTANGLFWSGNIAMSVGLTLTNGGTVILQPYFEAETALRLIEEERVSFLYGRPHQWARLQEATNWATVDLSSLRYIPRGELLWSHPTVHTNWSIPMGYGNTETMSISTSNAYNASPVEIPGTFGTPLPGNILKIVDPRTGVVVPRGSSGEICIKGPTLMTGYIGKTIEDTFDEQGYFRTGDGGHVDEEGRLFFEGRMTDIIKTGGANVSPNEIDEVLALYPGIRRAQTIGLPHETLGEMIVSCIIPNDGVTLEVAAITAYLKERLASFKVPKRILFLREDDLEITGSGKIKATALRELISAKL